MIFTYLFRTLYKVSPQIGSSKFDY